MGGHRSFILACSTTRQQVSLAAEQVRPEAATVFWTFPRTRFFIPLFADPAVMVAVNPDEYAGAR
jgi:hypothetical protein